MVQLSIHTWLLEKTIALTICTFVSKVMSLLFNMQSKLVIDFPGGLDRKASAYNVGHPDLIPRLGRSTGEGKWQPTPVLLPGKSHGWRSLVGYRAQGCKESDTTERLHFTSLFSKRQASYNFMAAVTICSDFGAQENKVCHCFHCFPIDMPWSDGTGCHDLSFLNAEF